MNIETVPNTIVSSVVKNGKAVVIVALAGVATLAVIDAVKELRK